MEDVISTIGEGFRQSFLMAYEVWWALVLGFAISAIVQAWVPRDRIQSALSGSGFAPLARATGLGAASSSCSYAAIAIAKSLFQKGASAASGAFPTEQTKLSTAMSGPAITFSSVFRSGGASSMKRKLKKSSPSNPMNPASTKPSVISFQSIFQSARKL